MNGTGLVQILNITQEAQDCLSAILEDSTADYGVSGHPLRNQLALYVYLNKRSAALADTPVAIDNTTPLTSTRWTIALQGDSWYPGIVFGFLIWSAGTYTQNQCVYYSGSYYIVAVASTTETPGAGVQWTLITNILGTCLNLNTNVEQTQFNAFTVCNGAVKAGASLQPLGQKIVNGSCKNWQDAANALFVGALVRSAKVNHLVIQDQDAQEIMDYVNSRFQA